MIESVLAKDINGLEPRLTRQGYNAKVLAELLNAKPREIKSFLSGHLAPNSKKKAKCARGSESLTTGLLCNQYNPECDGKSAIRIRAKFRGYLKTKNNRPFDDPILYTTNNAKRRYLVRAKLNPPDDTAGSSINWFRACWRIRLTNPIWPATPDFAQLGRPELEPNLRSEQP
jgi:hypothetical protein